MIIEELIEPAAVDVERLRAQQERDRQARNAANLEAWHCQVFGDVAGRELAHGWRVEYSVACCGIDNRRHLTNRSTP